MTLSSLMVATPSKRKLESLKMQLFPMSQHRAISSKKSRAENTITSMTSQLLHTVLVESVAKFFQLSWSTMALKRFTKSKVESLSTARSTATKGCGKARSTHLMLVWPSISHLKQKLLASAKAATHQLNSSITAPANRATNWFYSVKIVQRSM